MYDSHGAVEAGREEQPGVVVERHETGRVDDGDRQCVVTGT
jgi:hypothetical protein